MNYLDLIYVFLTVTTIILFIFGCMFLLFAYSRKADRYALENLHETAKLQHQNLIQLYAYINSLNNIPAPRLSTREEREYSKQPFEPQTIDNAPMINPTPTNIPE